MRIITTFILLLFSLTILFSQTFQKSQQNVKFYNYKRNADGNFIALGGTSIYNSEGNDDFCIAKFDNTGNIIAIKVINQTYAIATHREKIETFDDSTIIVSLSMPVDSINQYGDTVPYFTGILIKFDNDLNLLSSKQWSKTYICDMHDYNSNIMTSYVLGC